MANEAQNKLTLRVGVVLDKDATTKEWIRLQKQINDIEDSTMRRRKKNSDDVQDNLKQQTSLMGKLNKEAGKTVTNFLKFVAVSSIFMAITQSFRSAFELSLELNKAWTNFNIVAKASETQLAMVDAQINDMAISLGKLKTEIIDATTEFIRAGYSIEDSMIIAENGIKAANAGMVDMDDITKYLIAGLKSFKMEAEDSARILDVLFSVANITAIDLEGIGEAFLRSANTLKFSGASLEESAALIAAANETIQDPAKVGTALKTIASRLRGVGEEGEVVPTLANDFKRVGVEIQNADGSFRDIYSIFTDFSKVYQNLDDLTKQSLIEKIAGKRQANILVGLLENFDLAQTSLETAYNSAGEVARANALFVESLEGKINILRNSVNKLSQELLSGSGFKVFVEGLTAAVKIIDFLTSGISGVVTGLGLMYVGIKGVIVIMGILAGEVALATGGLSVLFGFLSTIIGGIVTLNGVTDTFGESIEDVSQSIARLNSDIASLETSIENLRAKANKTDEENAYLEVLEKQLEVKKRLLEIDNTSLINQQSDKSKEIIDDILKIREQIATLEGDYGISASEAFELDPNYFEDIKNGLLNQEAAMLSQIQTLKDLQSGVDVGSEAWIKAETNIKSLTDAIDKMKTEYGFLGVWIDTTTKAQEDAIDAQQVYKDLLGNTNSLLVSAAENHDLLKSAIEQMTEKGYITQDMITSLTDNGYGNLVAALSEGEEGFISLATVMLSNNKAMVESELERTRETIANIKVRIAGYEQEINAIVNAANAAGASTIGAGIFASSKTGISEAKKNLDNLENAAGLLQNKLLELTDIETRESDTKKSSTSTTEKSTEALTANERALRDVNQAIALNQKLQSRTEDEQEKIKLNNDLMQLYKDQIKIYKDMEIELKNNNKGITASSEGYDEYIDNLYQLSLNIEEATNGIYALTVANQDMINSFLEGKIEAAQEKIEGLSETMSDLVDAEIQKLKEKQDEVDATYESEINALDESIDALKEKNELLDEQAQLELKLANLRELIAKRDAILANKNARIVKDSEVGFEWISDPRELRAVGEEIADAEKDIADFRLKIGQNAELRALEELKANKEEEQRIAKESYDTQIAELELFQSTMNTVIEAGGKITSETWQTVLDTLSAQNTSSLNGMLSQLGAFVSQYNATMNTITQSEAQKDLTAELSGGNSSNQNSYLQNLLTNGNYGQKEWAKAQLGITSTLPTATNMSSNLSPVGSTSNSSMNISQLNVNSNATSVDALVKDAARKTSIMKYTTK